MPWQHAALILIAVAVIAFSVSETMLLVQRVMAVARKLKDPRQLGALLGEDTRANLSHAGHDPDSLRIDTKLSPELRRQVGDDLRRALQASMSGGGLVGYFFGKRGPSRTQHVPLVFGAPPTPPGPQAAPPPPYAPQPDTGARLRWIFAALILGAAAIYLTLG